MNIPEIEVYNNKSPENQTIDELFCLYWGVFGSEWNEGGINRNGDGLIAIQPFLQHIISTYPEKETPNQIETFHDVMKAVKWFSELPKDRRSRIEQEVLIRTGYKPFHQKDEVTARFTSNMAPREGRSPIVAIAKNESGSISGFASGIVLKDPLLYWDLIKSAGYIEQLPQAKEQIDKFLRMLEQNQIISSPILFQDEAAVAPDARKEVWLQLHAKVENKGIEDGCCQAMLITNPSKPYYKSLIKHDLVVAENPLTSELSCVVLDLKKSMRGLTERLGKSS